ncbi:MAG: Spy/CpxP family protein refolding chaperone [Alphaproteobacteria bacterium]|nr:Spy/CpxP family protein refolding chaperone [Alphaproteobacteria bacterium]
MTRKSKWLVGGLAVAALGAAAVGAVARHDGHGWRHHGGHHSWGHHRRGKGMMKRPMRMVCGRRAAERIDHMLVRIKHKADITDAQTPLYEEFADTVRAAATKARESCPPKPAWKTQDQKADDDDSREAKPRLRRSPIERLENMEKMLVAGLEAIRTVRPSAEKLYASLSEEQQTKLRKMRGKRGWWKYRKWRRHRDRDEDHDRSDDRERKTDETR